MHTNGIDMRRPNGSGDYLLLFFRCPTEVNLHGTYEPVPENTFLLYNKGTPQIYRKTDGDFCNDWLHFELVGEESFFEDLGIPFDTPISLNNADAVTDIIHDLFLEFFEKGPHHEQILDHRLHILFYKFCDLYQISPSGTADSSKYSNVLTWVREMIKNHLYMPMSADELATTLGISTSYLQHIYKDCFDVTLQQDIINGRINHACYLLECTSYTIGEIAILCHYNNIEHFSRQFRERKGCSPTKYRQNHISFGKELAHNE